MSRVHVTETNLPFNNPLKPRQPTRYFVIHHVGKIPASLSAEDIDAAVLNDWHKGRGWSGIGYHYAIRTNGEIQRGRPRWAIGAHDGGENACSIGICVIGDFSDPASRPSEAQMEALCALLADLCDIYGLLPDGEDPVTIVGHRDNEPPETPTECPGEGLYSLLPEIRIRTRGLCGF